MIILVTPPRAYLRVIKVVVGVAVGVALGVGVAPGVGMAVEVLRQTLLVQRLI